MAKRQKGFDEERILDWLSAYVAACAEADRKDETVKVKGWPYKVCPKRLRKADLD